MRYVSDEDLRFFVINFLAPNVCFLGKYNGVNAKRRVRFCDSRFTCSIIEPLHESISQRVAFLPSH